MFGKKKACGYCGGFEHTELNCYQKPRKQWRSPARAMRRVGRVTAGWTTTRRKWIKANPPDEYGFWVCYLHIHEWCPGRVDIHSLTLDHVKSRSRHPELRYELSNLKPACTFCNSQKSSQSVEELGIL